MELINIGMLVTQMIAFLVVFLVLRKYAWGPILSTIDDRREKIESQIQHAEQLDKQAEERLAEYEAKMREIEGEARDRINAAVEEGRQIAEKIQQEARDEARNIMEQGKRNVELELAKAQTVLEERSVDLIIELTGRLLKEKLNADQHRSLVREFVTEASRN